MAGVEVTIRELRHRGGDVVDRVEHGESAVVTRDGRPVAELRPLPRRPINRRTLLARWRTLPAVRFDEFRRDVDGVTDQSL